MKKLMTLILSGVMVLLAGMQVFAAPSIVGSIDLWQISSDEADVTWRALNAMDYPQEIVDLVNQVNQSGPDVTVKDSFGTLFDLSQIRLFDKDSVYLKNAGDLPGKMYYLSPMLEVVFNDVTPSADNPVRVNFTVNNLTDGMDVYALYYCPEHGWELIEAEVTADNQVTVAFHNGTSAVALVYIDNGVMVDANGISPKTGENSMSAVQLFAAAAFVIFGIFAYKKSRRTAG